MIEYYSFGKIVINQKLYQSDVIICGDRVIADWWRKTGHELCVADIETAVKDFKPSVVVVGTGKFGLMKVLKETIEFLDSSNIRIIVQKTGKAYKTFNDLFVSEKPMGAFHLTC